VLSDQLSQNEDLCQLFKVSRTVTVDDQAESFFLIPQVTLSWQTNSVGFSAWLSLDAGKAGGLTLGFALYLVADRMLFADSHPTVLKH